MSSCNILKNTCIVPIRITIQHTLKEGIWKLKQFTTTADLAGLLDTGVRKRGNNHTAVINHNLYTGSSSDPGTGRLSRHSQFLLSQKY